MCTHLAVGRERGAGVLPQRVLVTWKGSRAIGMPHSRPNQPTVRRRISLLFLWCLLAVWSASGAYKNLSVKVGPVEAYASRQSQGTVTIAADPYPSETRIRTAFDIKGLSELGLVPINLIISNQGPDALSINGATITLLDPDYGSLQALPPKEVAGMILRQARSRREPLSPVPLPRSPIGRGRSRVEKQALEIEDDLIRKSLKRRIRPRATAWGFVFFQLPERKSSLSGHKIIIPDVQNDKTKQKLLYFDIEIK